MAEFKSSGSNRRNSVEVTEIDLYDPGQLKDFLNDAFERRIFEINGKPISEYINLKHPSGKYVIPSAKQRFDAIQKFGELRKEIARYAAVENGNSHSEVDLVTKSTVGRVGDVVNGLAGRSAGVSDYYADLSDDEILDLLQVVQGINLSIDKWAENPRDAKSLQRIADSIQAAKLRKVDEDALVKKIIAVIEKVKRGEV